MSGPSSLGTLLATRLDAVLGTTLAQHPVLLEGARGHAVTQAASALHPQDSVIRRGTGEVRDAGAQVRSRAGASADAGRAGAGEARSGQQAGQPQASARTVLSEPARLILALLVSRAQAPVAGHGAQPLWPGLRDPAAAARFAGTGAAGAARPAEQGQPGAAAARPAGGAAGAPGSATAAAASNATTAASTATAARGGERLPAGLELRADTGRGADAPRLAGNDARTDPAGAQAARPGATTSAGTNATLPLAASNPMAQALASTLARTVGASGVFYESHLARLAFGQTRPEALAREPQARLPQPSALAQAARAAPARGGVGEWLSNPITTDAPASARGEPASAASAPPIPGVHPEAAGIVRQQLETLANGQFAWQGEAWPGAGMKWEVTEERPGAAEEDTASWGSRLRLELPTLGTLDVRLQLIGNRVLLRVAAADSAEVLAAGGADLRARLLDAGLLLGEFSVGPLDEPARPEAP